MEQETRIAVVGIIVEDKEAVGEINRILHDYSPYIIGRMGPGIGCAFWGLQRGAMRCP